MRKAILFTAFDRLRYLQASFDSWRDVRDLRDWHVVFSIDPSEITRHVTEECEEFAWHAGLTNIDIRVNPECLGVLEHPYAGLSDLFEDYDFVVRAEDDLLVSEDILEYFTWAATRFAHDNEVGNVNAFTLLDGSHTGVVRDQKFNPLTWGTWADRWEDFIGPTWDRNYSTNNGTPGVEAGWDWNLNRQYAARGMYAVAPEQSRVQNIGVYGTHSRPENFEETTSFSRRRASVAYECR
jgi:hypothetical protein